MVPVVGAFTWGGWDAPPVALSGHRVYVGLDEATVAVDWRTGEASSTDLPGSRYPDINADRSLQIENASVQVLDATTGEVLLDLPRVGDRFASLSPDGKYVLVLPYLPIGEDGQVGALDKAVLFNVDTGRSVDLPRSPLTSISTAMR